MLLKVQKPLRITLELELSAEPITGRLYAEECPQHRFHGWLEFGAAIESACEEATIQRLGGAGSNELGSDEL